jgi:hypothetical protein
MKGRLGCDWVPVRETAISRWRRDGTLVVKLGYSVALLVKFASTWQPISRAPKSDMPAI